MTPGKPSVAERWLAFPSRGGKTLEGAMRLGPKNVVEKISAILGSPAFSDRERGDYWIQGLRDELSAIRAEVEEVAREMREKEGRIIEFDCDTWADRLSGEKE